MTADRLLEILSEDPTHHLITHNEGGAVGYVAGYYRIETINELDSAIHKMLAVNELCFLEIRCANGSRLNLGRPTTLPVGNKEALIRALKL